MTTRCECFAVVYAHFLDELLCIFRRGYRATSDTGQYSYVLDTLVMMVAKGASVISDGLVLILTCVKTLSSTRTMDSVNGKKDTLSSILLKDSAYSSFTA